MERDRVGIESIQPVLLFLSSPYIYNCRFMKPSDSFRMHRAVIRRLVESHHARNARVFGSVVRGDDTDGSDLDLLVDPQPGATLFDLGALQVDLEEALGIQVDLLTPGDLPPGFRAKVLAEAEPV